MMEIRIAVLSKTGARERNEDACGYWVDGGPLCCVLADGAGGHGGGDVAAQTAVETVLRRFVEHPVASSGNVADLIARANRDVIAGQAQGRRLADMRSTLVVLTIDPSNDTALWGHIGDSRLYLLRDGYVEARTRDHSLLQSMIDAGLTDPVQIAGHRNRSVLIASLGSDDGFEPEVLRAPLALRHGDAFLLCSDGFWEHASDHEIEATLQRAGDPADWLAAIEALIVAAAKRTQDNYSAIAVWCGEMDFSTRIA